MEASPRTYMQQYVIPADVVTNLTQDLADLDVELEKVDAVMGRTYWTLVACTVISMLILAVDIFRICRKWGKRYPEKIGDCEGHSV